MKIVDLSTDVAGRFAAKLFAMAGVEVLRPYPAQDGALALYLDSGKTRIGLDALAARLADADLVFTSFDSGGYCGLAAQGLDLPASAVQVTTSTFGSWGPYAGYRGGPLADWAAGGYLALTGDPDREPLIGPENLCAYAGGYTAAVAAEAALRERCTSGRGQHVDVSTMEAMLRLHQSTFARLSGGEVRQRTGRYAEVYPLVVRPCRDGHVSLGVVLDEEFDRLAVALERPDLLVDERFATREARGRNRDALDAELAEFLMRHDAEEIVALLQSHAVASAVVVDTRKILANPQFAYRDFWAGEQGARMPGNPVPPATVFASPGDESAPPKRASGDLPLAGTKVLDLTAFWAGPSATRNLGDLGATVTWVERPGSRTDFDPDPADPQKLASYLYHQDMNRHKRSVALDLRIAEGRDRALQLVASADIIVENFSPGVADRLGLGPAQLCAAHPRLIYVSLSGFGSGGPWGAWRSYGPNIEAASSVMARTGYAGGEPLRLGHTLPDGLGGVLGTLAALRGLRERDERGHGAWFDLSQLEAYAAAAGEEILASSMTGETLLRIGNRSRSGAIQGIFPCRGDDQWIAIRLTTPADVERFADVTGVIAPVPRDSDRIESLIAAHTRTCDKFELARALQRAGLEAFPALTPPELLADPHLAARNFFADFVIGDRRYAVPGIAFHGSRPLADPNGRAPRFNEHFAEVLESLDRSMELNRMESPS